MSYLFVALGSAIGGLARFILGTWIQRRLDDVIPRAGALPFPVGTLVINVVGSFILGALLVIIARSGTHGDTLRWLLAIGFCGGFTTFSTFSADTVALAESGAFGMAAVNVAASVAIALVAILAGATLARVILTRTA